MEQSRIDSAIDRDLATRRASEKIAAATLAEHIIATKLQVEQRKYMNARDKVRQWKSGQMHVPHKYTKKTNKVMEDKHLKHLVKKRLYHCLRYKRGKCVSKYTKKHKKHYY